MVFSFPLRTIFWLTLFLITRAGAFNGRRMKRGQKLPTTYKASQLMPQRYQQVAAALRDYKANNCPQQSI